MTLPLQELRQRLDSLDNDAFLDLCQTHFLSVYEVFTSGMSRPEQCRRLLDHVRRQNESGRLVEAIRGKASPGSDTERDTLKAPRKPAAKSKRKPVPKRKDDPLTLYCRNLEKAFALVDIVGAPIGDDSALPRLEQLYVEQALAHHPIAAEGKGPPADLPTACKVIGGWSRVVLLGEPAHGKSTLVQWITWQFAVARLRPGRTSGWPAQLSQGDNPWLPLPFILRGLPIRDGITWDELWQAFLNENNQRPLTDAVLRPLLDEGRVLFLLDGLDEIGNPAARRSLRDAVHEGIARHPDCRWLLTSRIVGYDEVPFHRWGSLEVVPNQLLMITPWYLAPFDDERIRRFVHNWYVCRAKSDDDVKRRTENLLEAVFSDLATTGLARVPFLLMLMATVHRNNVTLPNGQAKLYRLITDAYVETRPKTAGLSLGTCSPTQQWGCLTRVAMSMQQRRASAANDGAATEALFAGTEDMRAWLMAALDGDAGRAREFLGHLTRRTGLLLPRGEDRFAFIHLSFLEFFVAWFLKQQVQSVAWMDGDWDAVDPSARRDMLHRYAADPRWQVVLLFLCELLAAEGRRDYLEKRLFPVLFGKDFSDLTSGRKKVVQRGVLLARLVVDPHAGWDEKAGWDDPLRRKALNVCVQAEVAGQRLNQAEIWKHHALIAQALLHGEERAWILTDLIGGVQKEGLRALSLRGTGVTDLEPLRGLTALQSLNLPGTGVTDLRPLRGLTVLQTLSLNRTSVTDLGPLRELTALQTLSLNRTEVTDLEPLQRLTALQTLYLRDTGVTDLEPLRGLSSLRWLHLSRTKIPIEQMEALKQALPHCSIRGL